MEVNPEWMFVKYLVAIPPPHKGWRKALKNWS